MKKYTITRDGLKTTVQYQEGQGEGLFPVDLTCSFTGKDDAAASILADSACKILENLVERRLLHANDKKNKG